MIIIPESIVDMEAIGCNVEEALIVGEAGSTAEKYAQNIREHLRVTMTGIANIVMNIVF